MRFSWLSLRRNASLPDESPNGQNNPTLGKPPLSKDARGTRLHSGDTGSAADETKALLWLERLAQDVRYAFRSLRRVPAFTAVAVLTLALGIGATTAIFSVIDAVLIRPLAFSDSDRLITVRQVSPHLCPRCFDIPVGNFVRLREEARTINLTAMRLWSPVLRGTERTEVIRGALVSPNFFRVLGGHAIRGRTFVSDDSLPGRQRVLVISEEVWHARFGADPRIIGSNLVIDGLAYTVVGVLRPEQIFPPGTQVWSVLTFTPNEVTAHAGPRVDAFGRLSDGASLEMAQAEVAAISAQLSKAFPEDMRSWQIRTEPMRNWHDDVRPALIVCLVAVGFVLVIACINLAGLLLARLADRRRELALRAALGGGRARITRQLLTESVLVTTFGALAGIPVAASAVAAIRRALPEDLANYLPGWTRLHIDTRALGFSIAVAIVTGILVAIGPTIRSVGRSSIMDALKDSGPGAGTGTRRGRRRRALVVAEVAMAVVLLSAAGLLLRSVRSMNRANVGIRPDGVLTMTLQAARGRGDGGIKTDFFDRLAAEVEGVPGVTRAGTVTATPLSRHYNSVNFAIDGYTDSRGGKAMSDARLQKVTEGYFSTLQIPIVVGRAFNRMDLTNGPRVAVVNGSLARRYFGGESKAIGRTLSILHERYNIVGVVRDVYHNGPNDEAGLEIYVLQRYLPEWGANLVVRTNGDPALTTKPVIEAIRRFDPDVAVNHVRTMGQVVADFMSPYRALLGIMLGFGAVALLISAIGLYGVISYSVAQRTREFGVRMAVGASAADVLRLVISDGLRLAAIGAALGTAGALALTRLIAFLLYGVGATDALTIGSVVTTVAVIAIGASCLPALRATRVDPVSSLRAD